jgi:hypothetical protein
MIFVIAAFVRTAPHILVRFHVLAFSVMVACISGLVDAADGTRRRPSGADRGLGQPPGPNPLSIRRNKTSISEISTCSGAALCTINRLARHAPWICQIAVSKIDPARRWF